MAKLAPYTPEEIISLNEFQNSGVYPSFTCHNSHEGNNILVATCEGWVCPTCDYKQDWCHNFMADGSWKKSIEAIKAWQRSHPTAEMQTGDYDYVPESPEERQSDYRGARD